MFEPKYQLTNNLLTNITQIERFYGQIESLKLPKKLELNLTRTNLITSSYASNRIEGNPLTLPEVTNLLLDDRIPANRDEKEVVNYFDILKKLDEYKDRDFLINLVTDLHKSLLKGVDKTAGEIRNVQVVVGKIKNEEGNISLRVKHNPPYHKKPEIESHLSELLSWASNAPSLPVILRTGIFHHQFVYLHPFEDGNGRICRVLTALLFIRNGYTINKYFILDDYYDIDRDQYSDMLHSADTGDETTWLEYFSDGVKYSLQSALAKAKEAIKTLRFEEQPTPKERDVLKIIESIREATSQDIAEKLKVSRQQSHALLKSLIEKGLLDKRGITKNSYYFLK
jgi:Fic family protein